MSVNEEHERMTKIFAVNFMHRKEVFDDIPADDNEYY